MNSNEVEIDILKEYYKWLLWIFALTFAGSVSIFFEGLKAKEYAYIYFITGGSGFLVSIMFIITAFMYERKIVKLSKRKD